MAEECNVGVKVLTIDDTPAVLATADLLAVYDNGLFGADDGEGEDALR
jgi:hypothetical protein